MNQAENSLNTNSMDYRIDEDYAYFADIADMHVGNMLSNIPKIKQLVEQIRTTPNFYVMIGGDSTDNSSTQSASSVFDETYHGTDQIIECREILKPINSRILCVRSGNHGKGRAMKYNKLIPEQLLAEFLDVPYLAGCASVFLNVRKNLYIISSWHNSKKPNKMEWLHSDITFYEHLHTNTIERNIVAVPNKYAKIWTMREHYDVQSGSFLSWGGYAAEKGYRPLPTGCPVMRLNGENGKWNITPYYDISALK